MLVSLSVSRSWRKIRDQEVARSWRVTRTASEFVKETTASFTMSTICDAKS